MNKYKLVGKNIVNDIPLFQLQNVENQEDNGWYTFGQVEMLLKAGVTIRGMTLTNNGISIDTCMPYK